MRQSIEQFNKKYDAWLVAQLLVYGSNPIPKRLEFEDASMLSSATARMHMKWNGRDGYEMTKDEALIYWVMRFGVNGVVLDDVPRKDFLEAFRTLNPVTGALSMLTHNHNNGGWYINHRGLQRLKELGHEQT